MGERERRSGERAHKRDYDVFNGKPIGLELNLLVLPMYRFLVASVTARTRIIAAWKAVQHNCTGGHQCGGGLACERTSL